MQNACIHPQQGTEGTAVRSSTFLFKNSSQATSTVLEAQSYSTCSQSRIPAQPSTLKSTCKAKTGIRASAADAVKSFCRDRAADVAHTEGKAIPGTGKDRPLLLPQQRLQAPCLGFSLSTTVCYRRGEKNSPLPLLKDAETSHFEGAGGIKEV